MQASQRGASRLYLDDDLHSQAIEIPERTAHYLGHVLRLKQGDRVVVFNGRGDERIAIIESLSRRRPELSLVEDVEPLAEPALELVLVQSLIKSDAMDTVVQKAAELGVRSIVAVKTDFSVIKLPAERVERRLVHWRRVAQSACEQSGRHRPPRIEFATSLTSAFDYLPQNGLRVAFHAGATMSLRALSPPTASAAILVGPEGGFSKADLVAIGRARFELVRLGPRVLRADTAAIAACSAAQILWGDAAL